MNKNRQDKIFEQAIANYETGNGKSIIEILSIGFEPFLTDKEFQIHNELLDDKKNIAAFKKSIVFLRWKLLGLEDMSAEYMWYKNLMTTSENILSNKKEAYNQKEKLFRSILFQNVNIIREIHSNRDFHNADQYRNILIAESDLTRCFGCKDLEHSDDIISVTTYYTDILKSLMNKGFTYKGKHYVFYTAGAGQTRNKKSTFVSEEKLNENANRLFCGLTREKINKLGGMNTNKFLAYTSLSQTNSAIWTDFNIDKAIVVDDIEYVIKDQDVRFIYTESPEDKALIDELNNKLSYINEEISKINTIKKQQKKEFKESGLKYKRTKQEIQYEKTLRNEKKNLKNQKGALFEKYHKITRGKQDVVIPFTDGFGISLKKMRSSMIRLPFMKGLMSYCSKNAFKKWCSINGYSIHKITDIYGKSYFINDIDYIFTKSQFKMWNYYENIYENGQLVQTGWEVYKENFKKYKCNACICNVEGHVKLNAKTNYQILQTLTTEMTDDDILHLAEYDITNLNGIGNDVQSMLNILGANEDKTNQLSWFQKSLILYPEMLKDFYTKNSLKNTKESMIKRMRSGKFNINGAYTFAIPDPLACLQWWFTDMDKSDLSSFGFVQEGTVSCKLFEDNEKIDCLRSPHLDHAHCIRVNKVNQDTRRWTKSMGVYIGMTDIMSKLLMYDNDGDKLLVHNNKVIIKCAEQFQKKYQMIPNYYQMSKAKPDKLTNDSLYNGIVMAYNNGNIGLPSNEITKIWSSLNPDSTIEEIQTAIEIISLRCADVNFVIDYAKTLYKPFIPNHIKEKYKEYSSKKLPHFFIYAKNKKSKQVEPLSNCNIDRICKVVHSNRIVFKNILGKYNYKILTSGNEIDLTTDKSKEIVNLYRELDTTNRRKLSHIDFVNLDHIEKNKIYMLLEFNTKIQRETFTSIVNETPEYITDVLVKALKTDVNKDTLWRLFGDVIYSNIQKNINGSKLCESCGQRFPILVSDDHSSKYCCSCKNHVIRKQNLARKQRERVVLG
jgi:hypothetical protein